MNFKTEIDALLRKEYIYATQAKKHTIIKVPVHTKNVKGYHFYCYDEKDFIGKGNFGEVYKAYPIDPHTGIIDYAIPYAAKVCTNPATFNRQEAKIFKRYYKAEDPVFTLDAVYFITEYFPGENLFTEEDKLAPAFTHLTFGQALELFQQLSIAFNLLQHQTIRTGEALCHSDIKGQNIRVDLSQDKSRIHVYIFDFGLSNEIADDPKSLRRLDAKGSPIYMAPEVFFKKTRGLKSDIYSLTGIIIALFGGKPFGLKQQAWDGKDWGPVITEKYAFKKFLDKYAEALKQCHLTIGKIFKAFLDRMQSDYEERPDSDELAKFASSLNNFYKLEILMKNSPEQADSLIGPYLGYSATIILLAKGLWKKDFYSLSMEEETTFCNQVMNLYASDRLDASSLSQLAGLLSKKPIIKKSWADGVLETFSSYLTFFGKKEASLSEKESFNKHLKVMVKEYEEPQSRPEPLNK